MSELNAVKCVCELNGFRLMGSIISVDFAKVNILFLNIFIESL